LDVLDIFVSKLKSKSLEKCSQNEVDHLFANLKKHFRVLDGRKVILLGIGELELGSRLEQ